MDRVRTGLTGLGLVFLFTLGSFVLLAPDASHREAGGAVAVQGPSEPLAQLGVAPKSDKQDRQPEVEDILPVMPDASPTMTEAPDASSQPVVAAEPGWRPVERADRQITI